MHLLIISVLTACFDKQAPSSTKIANAATTNTSIVATWDGGSLNYTDGTKMAKGQLVQMEADYLTNKYNAEKNSIEQVIMEKLFEEEMKSNNYSSQEELLKKEVEEKVQAPQPEQISSMFEQFKDRLAAQGILSLEQATPLIAQQLMQQQQQERFLEYMDELKKKHNVSITLPYPEVPRMEVSADDDPFLGTDGAPIEIIQFAEFQCPYCGKAGEAIDQVLEEYKGKVKMVYRDFPLGFHDRAIPAAVAANCAGEQDKYWEMHKLLMSNQRALSEADLTGHATTLKLDMDKWNTCRKDPKQEAEVKKDMEDGAAVGVTGTPAFFINGIMLSGALPFSEFKTIIDKELESLNK
jgi:protein-disulfide isomerase